MTFVAAWTVVGCNAFVKLRIVGNALQINTFLRPIAVIVGHTTFGCHFTIAVDTHLAVQTIGIRFAINRAPIAIPFDTRAVWGTIKVFLTLEITRAVDTFAASPTIKRVHTFDKCVFAIPIHTVLVGSTILIHYAGVVTEAIEAFAATPAVLINGALGLVLALTVHTKTTLVTFNVGGTCFVTKTIGADIPIAAFGVH